MKQSPLLLIISLLFTLCTTASAQPSKWFKKARKAQLSIITYDASGQMLRSTNGFFIDESGIALTDYSSFRGAVRAVAIDESGKEWPVSAIAGANSLYDVVKIKVDIKKCAALTIAATPAAAGAQAYVMPYVSSKAGAPTIATIDKVETFNERYAQYSLPIRVPERSASCPVMNEAGEVLGLLQMAVGNEERSYAISAAYACDLSVTALSATMNDYRELPIRKTLPAEADQASSFIYLTGTRDTALYLAYVDDFIAAFPDETSGYTMRAEMLTDKGDYTAADAAWEAALKAKANAQEILYSRARSTYGAVQSGRQLPEAWTLDRAMTDIDAASAEEPSPVYTALKGHILYAKKDYAGACNAFVEVNKSSMRDASYFLYASQCQQMLGDTTAVLALQDSAVACFTKPYVEAAAPSLLMRAQTHLAMGHYRLGVVDLIDYEHLKRDQLNANFYYQREQAELKCRMFQQALTDIEQAVRMEPREPLFQAEAAALYYRFNMNDEAVAAARKAIALDDSFADAYRILGLSLRAKGDERAAVEAFDKAISLGDELAKTIKEKK
jgi:tetratricopeptide (TPR) repeat protein